MQLKALKYKTAFFIGQAPEYADWQQYPAAFEDMPLGYYPAMEIIDDESGTIYLDDVGFYETRYQAVLASPPCLNLLNSKTRFWAA